MPAVRDSFQRSGAVAFDDQPRYSSAHMTRTALVTGASAGIGLEFARELARDGFDLVLVARRKDRLDAAARALQIEFGVRAIALAEDLADSAAPARLMSELARHGVVIDVLVNNAGSGIAK